MTCLCLRCGYKWTPRGWWKTTVQNQLPKRCARCPLALLETVRQAESASEIRTHEGKPNLGR